MKIVVHIFIHSAFELSLTSIFDHNATTGDHYNIGNENAKAFHSEIGENAKQILGGRNRLPYISYIMNLIFCI